MILHAAALIILAASLPLPEVDAAAPLIASPLFGNSFGGDPFDDGTMSLIPQVARLNSIRICYGDMVDGIQLIYMLQDNGTFVAYPHGKIRDNCGKDSNMSKITFKEGETLVHIEGLVQIKWRFISQLSLFTSISGSGGPPKLRGKFGRGGTTDIPFSLTGDVRGIFGRAGDLLDSVGFYVNSANLPLSSYRKTNITGGNRPGTDQFDDFEIIASKGEKPLKITSMVISHGVYINAFQVTYLTSTGVPISLLHGTLNTQNWLGNKYFDVLDFDDDEWITRVNISPRYSEAVNCVGYLELETTNSKGSIKSYGPFGQLYLSNITTIDGVIHGFHGSSTDYLALNTLGFYV